MPEETNQPIEELSTDEMKVEEKVDPVEEKAEPEETQEEPKEEDTEENNEEEDEELDAKEKLPFPTAAVVRLMKSHLDKDKMIKKDVKVAMNKWLGEMCAKVAKGMNKFPYVMMHRHEFEHAKRPYEDLENFEHEKQRILAHFEAIKHDIKRLERDLGKKEDEHEIKSADLE